MMGTSAELSLTQIFPKKVIVRDWGRGSFLVAQVSDDQIGHRRILPSSQRALRLFRGDCFRSV